MPQKTILKVKGTDLLKKIKAVLNEGNVRRIIIKDEKGNEYLEIPVNVGVLGAVFAPILVAVGAIAAMAASFTIEVIKREEVKKRKPAKSPKKK